MVLQGRLIMRRYWIATNPATETLVRLTLVI